MEGLVYLVIFVILIIIGYLAGSRAEKKHYASIIEREKKHLNLPAVTIKNAVEEKDIDSAKLVSGEIVVSLDYFKRVLAGIINIFGGNITSYESLVDRAKREAVLRMKDQAGDADIILNLRIITSSISNATSSGGNSTVGTVEAIAYGTAVKLVK